MDKKEDIWPLLRLRRWSAQQGLLSASSLDFPLSCIHSRELFMFLRRCVTHEGEGRGSEGVMTGGFLGRVSSLISFCDKDFTCFLHLTLCSW